MLMESRFQESFFKQVLLRLMLFSNGVKLDSKEMQLILVQCMTSSHVLEVQIKLKLKLPVWLKSTVEMSLLMTPGCGELITM